MKGRRWKLIRSQIKNKDGIKGSVLISVNPGQLTHDTTTHLRNTQFFLALGNLCDATAGKEKGTDARWGIIVIITPKGTWLPWSVCVQQQWD